MFAFFLSSGLFLGWSLGANDASNVFGTAVGSKMIRFKTAAICCSIFIILGSVLSGAGASHTLGKLGEVNAIAGAFIVAFAAALSVYLMTRMRFPVSTSQAIVGAIIGWNIFSGSVTDTNSLTKIVITWVACPALAAVLAIILYKTVVFVIHHFNIPMFHLDMMTRWGLLLVGAFGSYSLGANNIANVMGVFIPVSPFTDISIFGVFNLSSAQQLFFIGGVAIAVGVLSYSRRVMETVGEGIMQLSPVAAFVVVSAHSLVLFLFASQGLERFLTSHGLPAIPLVPVSSSQAIVGAVIGIGLLKGGRGIRWRTLGGITSGWVITPIIAGVFSLLSLFFLQNVFHQNTYQPITYKLTPAAMTRIKEAGISTLYLAVLADKDFDTAVQFNNALDKRIKINSTQHDFILSSAEIDKLKITQTGIDKVNTDWISPEQLNGLIKLKGRSFEHKWQLVQALGAETPAWQSSQNSKNQNDELNNKLANLFSIFRQ
ncbi:MAG: anion permease [Desulfobacteraceae bacterium]|jgi:PiT family inorganic phosphate transporter|nr:anion permease [Desulfobacteraceae bacterium]